MSRKEPEKVFVTVTVSFERMGPNSVRVYSRIAKQYLNLPKSQIRNWDVAEPHMKTKGNELYLDIPDWLAKKQNLIAEC